MEHLHIIYFKISAFVMCGDLSSPPKFKLSLKEIEGRDYMSSFILGRNFAPPTGLKFCCDCTMNFSPGAKHI